MTISQTVAEQTIFPDAALRAEKRIRKTRCHRGLLCAAAAYSLLLAAAVTQAQGPTNIGAGRIPRSRQNESSLGAMPGSGGNMSGDAPDASRPIIGGAPGATTPVVPPSISNPSSGRYQNLGGAGMRPTPELPPAELPLFGVLALPGQEDQGPPNGLTLDQALQRLMSANLDLRSRYLEIPQARADVLTAGLYANPLVFFDTQLVPYGSYTTQRPGGQTQYDLNISHPIDLSHKRRERTRVAALAEKVIEAQFQDAVRLEIANLYEAYLGVLLAREAVRFSQAAIDGLDEVLATIREQQAGKIATTADVDSVLIQREFAASSLVDSQRTYHSTKVRLATLLALPAIRAERMELRGSLKVTSPAPPLGDDLIELALRYRPDLRAFRMGLARSQADTQLALANRMADIYVLFQPFTLQDNRPIGKQSPTSWAAGVTVPVPLYNRNQGNIRRSRINVRQSQLEFESQQLRVISEVKQAENEYLAAREAIERMERTIRPAADRVLAAARLRWRSGDKDVLFYLAAVREYNVFVRQYLTDVLRFRRAMLRLNTVAGQRILP